MYILWEALGRDGRLGHGARDYSITRTEHSLTAQRSKKGGRKEGKKERKEEGREEERDEHDDVCVFVLDGRGEAR